MRALIQRVNWSRVHTDGCEVSSTGPGMVVLLGVAASDGEDEARYLAARIASLRIFEDDKGKMNLSRQETGGEIRF